MTYPTVTEIRATTKYVQELVAREEAAAKRLASLRYERQRVQEQLRTD